MSDESVGPAHRVLEKHGAFERTENRDDDGHEVTTTPFDATVRSAPADADGRDARFDVEIAMPSLDATVADDVADVVEDGWFETLALRLEDAHDVVEVDPVHDPEIELSGSTVEARFSFFAWNADSGVDDAKAIVDFVEGTYVQGVIPGYEYEDPVADLLDRATQQAGGEDGGAERGGTPL